MLVVNTLGTYDNMFVGKGISAALKVLHYNAIYIANFDTDMVNCATLVDP